LEANACNCIDRLHRLTGASGLEGPEAPATKAIEIGRAPAVLRFAPGNLALPHRDWHRLSNARMTHHPVSRRWSATTIHHNNVWKVEESNGSEVQEEETRDQETCAQSCCEEGDKESCAEEIGKEGHATESRSLKGQGYAWRIRRAVVEEVHLSCRRPARPPENDPPCRRQAISLESERQHPTRKELGDGR
jgi:hypothetical protein